jgi:non-ribosomal peptide synthetase component F
MVVAVLGVLLAGGAYVPLDPELPAERRAYMLGDAAPVLLLTQAALAGRLEDCGVPLLAVDAEAETIARESGEAPETGVVPDNLAYVIYTSGLHRAVPRACWWSTAAWATPLELWRVYGAAPGDRHLAYAPLHFDSSVADIFVALCNGRRAGAGPPRGDAARRRTCCARCARSASTTSRPCPRRWRSRRSSRCRS